MSRTTHARPARQAQDSSAGELYVRRPRSASMARRTRRTNTRQAYIAAHLAERI